MVRIAVGWLMILWLILLTGGAWSQSAKPRQEESPSFPAADQKTPSQEDENLDKLFNQMQTGGEGKYLLMDPDGQTPSDYQKFLLPSGQNTEPPSGR